MGDSTTKKSKVNFDNIQCIHSNFFLSVTTVANCIRNRLSTECLFRECQ